MLKARREKRTGPDHTLSLAGNAKNDLVADGFTAAGSHPHAFSKPRSWLESFRLQSNSLRVLPS